MFGSRQKQGSHQAFSVYGTNTWLGGVVTHLEELLVPLVTSQRVNGRN